MGHSLFPANVTNVGYVNNGITDRKVQTLHHFHTCTVLSTDCHMICFSVKPLFILISERGCLDTGGLVRPFVSSSS